LFVTCVQYVDCRRYILTPHPVPGVVPALWWRRPCLGETFVGHTRNHVDIFCRLITMHERDRQTNKQTDRQITER